MYTSGLWDTGDVPSVPPGSGMETQGGPLPPSGDGGDEGAGLEPFRVTQKGPGRDAGPQASPGGATPLWGQPCFCSSRHSLDMTVVEGAIIIHLQREEAGQQGCGGQGTAPPPPPPSRSQVGLEHP